MYFCTSGNPLMKTGSTLSNLKPVTVKTNGNPAVCVPELYTFAGRVKSNLHKLKLLYIPVLRHLQAWKNFSKNHLTRHTINALNWQLNRSVL